MLGTEAEEEGDRAADEEGANNDGNMGTSTAIGTATNE